MQTLKSMHFLFKSTQFIINNFSQVEYAHWLTIKGDETSLAENLTGLVMPSTCINSVKKLQWHQESWWHSKMFMA